MIQAKAQGLRIVFAGTPDFAAQQLRSLLASEHELVAVYTQPDRPAGRGKKLAASPVKQLAVEHGIPVRQPPTLKAAQAQAELAELNADIMVVVAYGLLLFQAVINIHSFGCINIHDYLLIHCRVASSIHR